MCTRSGSQVQNLRKQKFDVVDTCKQLVYYKLVQNGIYQVNFGVKDSFHHFLCCLHHGYTIVTRALCRFALFKSTPTFSTCTLV